MTSATSTAVSVQETIASHKDEITQLHRDITPEGFDTLEEEVGAICVTVKSEHFKDGRLNGHLAAIIPEADYRTVISDATWTYAPPAHQVAYDPTALVCTAAVRAQKEAAWKRKERNLETHTGVCVGSCELIIYGAGEDAVIALRKKYIGYAGISPKAMFKYLREKTCVKMTTLEKYRFRTDGYKQAWDTTKPLTTYFKYLDEFHIKLTARAIETTENEKATAAVAQMWESEFFTEEKMVEWEKKTEAAQGWAHVQTYFLGLYHDHKQYSRATKKRARFNDHANNIEEKKEEEEGHDAAMMMTLMQDQHQEQLNMLKEQNAAAMQLAADAMKQMMAQMAQMTNAPPATANPYDCAYAADASDDKENAPPNVREGPSHGPFKTCKHCKKRARHAAEDCHTLAKNAGAKEEFWKNIDAQKKRKAASIKQE